MKRNKLKKNIKRVDEIKISNEIKGEKERRQRSADHRFRLHTSKAEPLLNLPHAVRIHLSKAALFYSFFHIINDWEKFVNRSERKEVQSAKSAWIGSYM